MKRAQRDFLGALEAVDGLGPTYLMSNSHGRYVLILPGRDGHRRGPTVTRETVGVLVAVGQVRLADSYVPLPNYGAIKVSDRPEGRQVSLP